MNCGKYIPIYLNFELWSHAIARNITQLQDLSITVLLQFISRFMSHALMQYVTYYKAIFIHFKTIARSSLSGYKTLYLFVQKILYAQKCVSFDYILYFIHANRLTVLITFCVHNKWSQALKIMLIDFSKIHYISSFYIISIYEYSINNCIYIYRCITTVLWQIII